MKLEVNITKTKLFILLGAILLMGGVIFTYAYVNPPTGGSPSVFGHSINEIDWTQTIPKINASEICLTGTCKTSWPVSGGSVNNIKIVQAFRKGNTVQLLNSNDASITSLSGIVTQVNNVNKFGESGSSSLDGVKCNDANGWYVTGCWMNIKTDIYPYSNGCITNDLEYSGSSNEILTIVCMKVVQ